MNLKSVSGLAKAALWSWMDDYAPSMGAALAYYTVFAIAPLFIIAIAVAAVVFGQDAAHAAIMDQARGVIGENGARAIEGILTSAQKPKQGVIAGALGLLVLIIGASAVFAELETNLNRIWKVEPEKGSGLWHFIRKRLLSFGMLLAIGFLLIVSLVISAVIAVGGRYWGVWFHGLEAILNAVNFLVSVAVMAILFAMIYRFMPRVSIRWGDVWIGALVTSLLFSLGKFLIELYIVKSGVESSYGAAGALVVLLIWVYYSAQIFLLGAEFTKAYAESHGSMKTLKARTVSSEKVPTRDKAAPRKRRAV